MLDSQQFNLDPLSQLWRCDDGKGLEISEEEDGTERLIMKPLSDEPKEMADLLICHLDSATIGVMEVLRPCRATNWCPGDNFAEQ